MIYVGLVKVELCHHRSVPSLRSRMEVVVDIEDLGLGTEAVVSEKEAVEVAVALSHRRGCRG